MNWWIDSAQYGTEALALLLIVRLMSIRTRREQVYYIFCLFLGTQLLGSLGYLFLLRHPFMDYRVFWMTVTTISWCASLLLVYSLARAVLTNLPGILKFSQRLLNSVFPLAIILALIAERSQFWFSGNSANTLDNALDHLVFICYGIDRAIALAAVLVLVVVLAFILWFPVRMSKNLAIFSTGLVVYFGLKTGLQLLRTWLTPGLFSNTVTQAVALCTSLVLVLCFLYWIVFIDAKGQTREVRLGHSWRPEEQAKLVRQLESMNWALLRSSRQV